MAARSPRDSYHWQQLRKRMVAAATVCAECGWPLWKDAPPRSPLSPSVDHIVPLSLGGEPFAVSNLRVLHYKCNSSLGARLPRRRRPKW